jgi:hypothetical protein
VSSNDSSKGGKKGSDVRKTQALTILSSILEETKSEAEAEREALAAAEAKKAEAAKAEAAAQDAQARAEAIRRIEEEEARQDAAASRRTMAAEALRVDDEPAVAAPVRPKGGYSTEQVVAVQKKAVSKGLLIGVAAAVAAIVGGAAAFGAASKNQVDATTSYAKVAIEEAPIASPKASFTFTPEPPPEAASVAAAPSARRGGGARSGGAKPAGAAVTAPTGPKIRLGGGIKTR